MENVFAEAKRKLNIADVVQRYAGVKLNRNNQCCCPFHGEKTASFTVYPNTGTYKCFGAGCDAKGDCVAFVARLKGLTELDAVKLLDADYRLGLKFVDCSTPHKAAKPSRDIRAYIQSCQSDIAKTDYFAKRGLTADTVCRFNLGYDTERKQVVIPYNKRLTYYQARSIAEKKFFKPKSEDAGSEPIYNEDCLTTKDKEPIFVVESPICAMSIMQSGGTAVATCGGSGVNKFEAKLKGLKHKPSFIISLDNDDGGKAATKELAELFRKQKISYVNYPVSGSEKDPNDLLQKSPLALADNIKTAKQEFYKKTTGFGDLRKLTDIMQTEFPEKDWFVKGLMSRGLYLLVAPPKAGKSFLALDMSLCIANGENFLGFETIRHGAWYMALEDLPETTKERCSKILRGRQVPDNLMMSYNSDYRITQRQDESNSIVEYIENNLCAEPNIKFIVIDTFQLIRGEEKRNENIYKYDYRELGTLKRFANEHEICILLVHHTRKGKDESNEFNEVLGSTAMNGGVDATFKITKQKNSDSEATFSVQARGVYVEPISMIFDRESFRWLKLGNDTERAERRLYEEYLRNDFRTIITGLIKDGGGQWSGTATQLVTESGKYLDHAPYAVTCQQVGRELKKIEAQLFRYDNIKHTEYGKGGKTGRNHIFSASGKAAEQQMLNTT